jgi:aspartyl-tRNA(Asn)/glutamyl-tRNA(Gln) amidotransferase subunit A
MCAELCNNENRFEGMKYGYHTKRYQTIGELYTKSRTEAFGILTKTAILYGSEVLAAGNYERCYDKGLRIRRLVAEAFTNEFAHDTAAGQTAILLPACAKRAYSLADVEANPYLAFEENRFTAPAAITGLPALVAEGVQLVGPAFSDAALLRLAGATLSPAALTGKEA